MYRQYGGIPLLARIISFIQYIIIHAQDIIAADALRWVKQ